MIHPSRFKYCSDFATTINDFTKTFTVVIPDSFTPTESGSHYVLEQEFTIGSSAASMRFLVKSSKTGKVYIGTSDFQLPAKVHSQIMGDVDSQLLVDVFRSSENKIKVRIMPNLGGAFQWGDSFYDMGQTLTFAISTFLNPLA